MKYLVRVSPVARVVTVIACLVALATFGLFDGPWKTCMLVSGLNLSECAAWVQAWGTIAAIAAAGFGVWYQVRRNEQTRSEEHFEASASYAKACFLVARDTASTLAYIARRLDESANGHLTLRTDRLEDLQATARSLLAKDLAPKVLDRVLRVQNELAYSLMALKELERRPFVSSARIEKAEKRAKTVAAIARDLGSYDMLYEFLADKELRRPPPSDEDHAEMEIEGGG